MFPKMTEQPLKEEYLVKGNLEVTDQPRAIAKIAGIKMFDSYCFQYRCNFISIMPTNMISISDKCHPENAHAHPSLIRRIVLVK